MDLRFLISICAFATQLTVAYAGEAGISDSEIRLGMVNAQTGNTSRLGLGMRSGAEAVFAEVNAAGGIFGRKITLIVDDDSYDPEKVIDKTLQMIEQKNVFALFGFVGTPTANAVLPIIKDYKIPLVGLFTGAMTLRSPVIPEIINIRASYVDEVGLLVDRFIADKGAKRFAVFFQDDGFGQSLLRCVELALERHGMKVSTVSTFQRGTIAIKSGLGIMLESKPEVIIMAGPYAPLAEFIKEAKVEGLKAALATVSFVGSNNLIDLIGADANGLIISQVMPFPSDDTYPVTKECNALLKKQGEELGFVNLEGCVSAKAMVAALKRAGPQLTRKGLITAFESMKELDIGGLKLTLSPSNHQALNNVYLTQIVGGKIMPTTTISTTSTISTNKRE